MPIAFSGRWKVADAIAVFGIWGRNVGNQSGAYSSFRVGITQVHERQVWNWCKVGFRAPEEHINRRISHSEFNPKCRRDTRKNAVL